MSPETKTGGFRDGHPCRPGAPLLDAPLNRPPWGRRMLGLSIVLHGVALFSLFGSGAGLGSQERPEAVVEVDFVTPPASDPEPQPVTAPEPEPPPEAPPPPPPPPPAEAESPPPPPPPEIKPAPPVRKPKPAPEARPVQKPPPAPVTASAPAAPAVSASPRQDGLLSRPDDALAAYSRVVWARIERRKPRDIHAPGVATVTFALGADGALLSARLGAGSGNDGLDRAALDAVAAAAPFPPPPAGVSPAKLVFSIPFQFR
ncbi:MAG: TonB family protein [Rhodospirillaceae bacterium]